MHPSREQIEQFHRDGYIYLGPVLSPEELEEARQAYGRLVLGENKPDSFRDLGLSDNQTGTRESVLQVLNCYRLDEVFNRIETRPDVVDVVEALLGTPSIRLYGDQALYKPPRHGSRVLWHQDNGYWQFEPAAAVSMWLALDDADESNGCMWVIPGSHREGLVSHTPSQENEVLRGLEVDESKAVPVHVPAGHAMMHHCLTIHATRQNHSDRPRRAIAITYVPAETRQNGEPMTEFPLIRGEADLAAGRSNS